VGARLDDGKPSDQNLPNAMIYQKECPGISEEASEFVALT
jgi:hypothetical protein